MDKFEYRFQPSEPAIIVEILLPKRDDIQGTLYDSLTAGMQVDHDQPGHVLASARLVAVGRADRNPGGKLISHKAASPWCTAFYRGRARIDRFKR